MMLSHFEAVLGDMRAALSLSERARSLDPISAATIMNRGRVLSWARLHAEAEYHYRRALELSPDIASGWTQLAWALHYQGKTAEAAAATRNEMRNGYRLYCESAFQHLQGDKKASDRSLQELIALGENWGCQIATVHAVRGEHDDAFRWLERSFELHDAGLSVAPVTPQLDPLHADPRWMAFLRSIGLRRA